MWQLSREAARCFAMQDALGSVITSLRSRNWNVHRSVEMLIRVLIRSLNCQSGSWSVNENREFQKPVPPPSRPLLARLGSRRWSVNPSADVLRFQRCLSRLPSVDKLWINSSSTWWVSTCWPIVDRHVDPPSNSICCSIVDQLFEFNNDDQQLINFSIGYQLC